MDGTRARSGAGQAVRLRNGCDGRHGHDGHDGHHGHDGGSSWRKARQRRLKEVRLHGVEFKLVRLER